MIQRLQSLYLLFVIISSTLIAVIFEYEGNENAVLTVFLQFYGLFFTPLFALITLMFFKKRIIQIHLCNLLLFFQWVEMGLLFWVIISTNYTFSIGGLLIVTLFQLIFLLLSRRQIRKDEELVRSIDRIR